MPLKKLERQWYTILCGNTKAVWVATLKPNPPLHVRPVWCPSYQVCNTLIDVVVSLWNVTTIPVFSMPVRERFSRELQGRPRPRGRATPAPHGGISVIGERTGSNAKLDKRGASKGPVPGPRYGGGYSKNMEIPIRCGKNLCMNVPVFLCL